VKLLYYEQLLIHHLIEK